MTLAPGSKLGPYEILEPIGAGGMGEVWKARDTRLGRIVAIKTVKEQHSERFKQEARSIAALNHPFICQLFDIGPDYLVLEYVEGKSLSSPLPEREAVRLAIQIATALEAAHKKGIIHRDLKPANIMVTEEGLVKLLDFGLAKLYEQDSSSSQSSTVTFPATQAGAVLGTVAYMSPEQAQGQPADARSDIFSFGLVLYEMLSGRRAFAGESSPLILAALLRDEPAPLQTSPALEKIVQRCLTKQPLGRYQTMTEVKTALEQSFGEKATGTSAEPQPSIAVLPFVNMSGDKEQEYFSDGLAEEIINALAKIPGLKVTARTSAFAFRGKDQDIRRIAETLNVRTILEGSVRKSGNRIRVTAQLINAADGYHVWSERYDRKERDVFDIQDEISHAIIDQLKVALLSGEKTALRKRSTEDIEAYNLYLKGLYFVARPSPESFQKALDFFRQAIDRDPNFAQAHAGVANVFSSMGIMSFAPPAEMYPLAKAALERTFALDPDLPEGHAIDSVLKFWFEWSWDEADKSFRRVLELNPGDAMSRGQYAWLLMAAKRFEECRAAIKRTLTLDPLMPLYYAWSIGLHAAMGRPDEALEDFARLQQIDPSFGLAYFHAGMALFRKGLYEDAIRTLQKGRELVIFPGWGEGVILMSHLRLGDRAQAETTLAEMIESRKRLPVSPVCLAWSYGVLGDLDKAFEWFETAARERDALTCFLNVYTEYMAPGLYSDPRFDALLSHLKLPR